MNSSFIFYILICEEKKNWPGFLHYSYNILLITFITVADQEFDKQIQEIQTVESLSKRMEKSKDETEHTAEESLKIQEEVTLGNDLSMTSPAQLSEQSDDEKVKIFFNLLTIKKEMLDKFISKTAKMNINHIQDIDVNYINQNFCQTKLL